MSVIENDKVRSAIAGACAGLASALITCNHLLMSSNGHGQTTDAEYQTVTFINGLFIICGYMEVWRAKGAV